MSTTSYIPIMNRPAFQPFPGGMKLLPPAQKSNSFPQTQTEGEHPGPSQTLNAGLFSLGNAPLDNGRDTFAVIGDAGTGDANQYQVVNQMMNWKRAFPFKSVLLLGDNVYPKGEPERFKMCISDPLRGLTQQGVRFFPVLGNHDVKSGFGDQQLAFWGVPPYYNWKVGKPGQDVEFFALDTTCMLPSYYGDSPLSAPISSRRDQAQQAWLEHALARSTASMKVVMGHYPLFSKGAYAKIKRLIWQRSMEQKLAPLLEKYNVDLYLAGHEHHYQPPYEHNGVRYVVSGAGGKLDPPTKGLDEKYGIVKRNHFMLFENTSLGLRYRTISAEGDVFDAGLIPRKSLLLPRPLPSLLPPFVQPVIR